MPAEAGGGLDIAGRPVVTVEVEADQRGREQPVGQDEERIGSPGERPADPAGHRPSRGQRPPPLSP